MTVARLQERMDQRFKVVDKRFEAVDQRFDQLTVRMDAGFRSMHDKLDKLGAILHSLDNKSDHHFNILNEHDERLSDLESWRRTGRNIAG
jgi:hypothetical protein